MSAQQLLTVAHRAHLTDRTLGNPTESDSANQSGGLVAGLSSWAAESRHSQRPAGQGKGIEVRVRPGLPKPSIPLKFHGSINVGRTGLEDGQPQQGHLPELQNGPIRLIDAHQLDADSVESVKFDATLEEVAETTISIPETGPSSYNGRFEIHEEIRAIPPGDFAPVGRQQPADITVAYEGTSI